MLFPKLSDVEQKEFLNDLQMIRYIQKVFALDYNPFESLFVVDTESEREKAIRISESFHLSPVFLYQLTVKEN